MPYYTPPFNVGAKLARRLQLGLSPGDEFVVTWEQHINQTRYHQLRLSSLNCSKCIMNNINEVRKSYWLRQVATKIQKYQNCDISDNPISVCYSPFTLVL
ncbi:unnamed protein product [Cylicocyclus nassatus]|uniref:Uncharacterized protein n=1 Tax=Cylicocyclus nassatus TaxID=53992 RepID=A0AA36MBY9_CYLNA|nr:unnamed protein product [Cylicocyclus nassatus]